MTEMRAVTVSDLDGTDDAADWITTGHVLDQHEVEYLRSLVLPETLTRAKAGHTPPPPYTRAPRDMGDDGDFDDRD